MMELLEAGRHYRREPHRGRTGSEPEELLVLSSQIDARTEGVAGPAVFQARWTVEAIAAGFVRAIHALKHPEAKRIS
jgi:hypothetical protein